MYVYELEEQLLGAWFLRLKYKSSLFTILHVRQSAYNEFAIFLLHWRRITELVEAKFIYDYGLTLLSIRLDVSAAHLPNIY